MAEKADKKATSEQSAPLSDDDMLYELLSSHHFGFKKLVIISIIVFVAISGFAVLAWNAYKYGNKPKDIAELTIVEAPKKPFKEAPDDPGGMVVPNMDKSIYNVISKNQIKTVPKVEKILPAPEAPVAVPNGQAIQERTLPIPEVAVIKEEELPMVEEETIIETEEVIEVVEIIDEGEETPVVATPASTIPTKKTQPVSVPVAKEEPAKSKPMIEKTQKTASSKVIPAKTQGTSKKSEPVIKVVAKPKQKPIRPQDIKQPKRHVKLPKQTKVNSPFRIQLGAFRTEKDAVGHWKNLTKKHKVLSGLSYKIERKDLNSKGIFYRLQAVPFANESAARQVCKKLIARNQGCFFIKR